ncbi:RNase adapter RapZ [Chryseomicrobium excrementi]|uniref:RNase adapter RapZ n=1 Tax=Chryseomicrobium excrementi TaxID=2041346 RepID=A0A2M9F138_9BACL|nr:RNase adapter RapZ [Chryseomicrobium excrementi]PJK17174.1 RNase adapter RapZ [Chryseomicrobium excrementi]
MNLETPQPQTDIVIITGMSGAGKSVAIQSFEDMGYYCIDNLPPDLLATFVDLLVDSDKQLQKIALVMDVRGGEVFGPISQTLNHLQESRNISPRILFLEADNQTLVSRYKESRRSHPLAKLGLPLEGISKERLMLEELKGRAQHIIDTSNLKPKQLREEIEKIFSTDLHSPFIINVMSFGFKHGLPIDADLVFDVRFLPNPFYIEELRPMSGRDHEVSSYVMKWSETKKLVEKLTDLFEFMIPHYKREGKSQLVIAFGCTGGQHRSVTLAEYFGDYLQKEAPTVIRHRDVK